MNYNDIITETQELVNIIGNSKDVEFILDLPLIYDSINFMVGDSGVGKTILNQCIINSLLEKEKNCIVVWLDFEFQPSIAKQRGIDNLINKHSNLFYIDVEAFINKHNSNIDKKIDEIKNTEKENDKDEKRKKIEQINILMKEKIENPIDFVLRISETVCNNNKDKRVIFVIDSFEDVVENTSDDARIKVFLRSLLNFCSQNATYIISHHIGKKQDILDSMRFRGSMVIKNKCASMLLIHSKEKEENESVIDDTNNYVYNMEIIKLRAYACFSRKFFITVALLEEGNYNIKKIEKNYDIQTRQVIREAFFLLYSSNQKQMKKTDLILGIYKTTKVAREKVRSIIDANNDLFNVSVDKHNTQIYSLNMRKIDQICLIAGIPSTEYLSSQKRELIKMLDNINDDVDLDIEIRNSNSGISIYKKKAAILNSIFSITDEDASEITKKIREIISPF